VYSKIIIIVVIEDGMIVNPYLKKRSRGKKIVKSNPLYKKDVMSSSTVNVGKPPAPPSQDMSKSVSDRFSKELGAHGYLKHSKPGPNNYAPPDKVMPDKPYESQENSVLEEEEPYRREAGRASLGVPKNSHRNQNIQKNQNQYNSYDANRQLNQQNRDREIGSRNMNRRLVEKNILRNASAERPQNDANRLQQQNPAVNQSFQHKHSDSLDDRIQQHYDSYGQKQTNQQNNSNLQNYAEKNGSDNQQNANQTDDANEEEKAYLEYLKCK
jgi:hypothetical protein